MAGDKTEIRFELPTEEVGVLDGYCSATGKARTDVLRSLLREWSDRKLHEAESICRVVGVNPLRPERRGKPSEAVMGATAQTAKA